MTIFRGFQSFSYENYNSRDSCKYVEKKKTARKMVAIAFRVWGYFTFPGLQVRVCFCKVQAFFPGSEFFKVKKNGR